MLNTLSKSDSVIDPKGADSRIPTYKEYIDSTFLLINHVVQTIKICQIWDVTLNTDDIFAYLVDCFIKLALTSAGD
jgi:hypothetical protein